MIFPLNNVTVALGRPFGNRIALGHHQNNRNDGSVRPNSPEGDFRPSGETGPINLSQFCKHQPHRLQGLRVGERKNSSCIQLM